MISIIDGKLRFTVIQETANNTVSLCFYEKQEDLGILNKAVAIIQFPDFQSLHTWTALQFSLAQNIYNTATKTMAEKN